MVGTASGADRLAPLAHDHFSPFADALSPAHAICPGVDITGG